MWGFHVVGKNNRLRYSDGRKVKVCEKLRALSYRYTLSKITSQCGPGMHASPTFKDAAKWRHTALSYTESQDKKGENVCVVEVERVAEDFASSDKFVGMFRTPYIIMSKKRYLTERAAWKRVDPQNRPDRDFDNLLIKKAKNIKANRMAKVTK
jgi:hypothetical protein